MERLLTGDRVSLVCKGKGCRKSATRKPVTVKRGTSLKLTKYVKGIKLAPKATLAVTVTRPGAIGREVTYTVVRRKDPKKLQRCLPVGQVKPKPQRC